MDWLCLGRIYLKYLVFILLYTYVTTVITNIASLVKFEDIDFLRQLVWKYFTWFVEKIKYELSQLSTFIKSQLSRLIILLTVNSFLRKFNPVPTLSKEFEDKVTSKQSNLRHKISEFLNETFMIKLDSTFPTGTENSQLSRIINYSNIILRVELRKAFLNTFIGEFKHLLPYCVPQSIKSKAFVIENARVFMKIDIRTALKNALHFPILWAQYVETMICRAIESDRLYVRIIGKEDNTRKLLIEILRDGNSTELKFKCELTLRICMDSPPEKPEEENYEDDYAQNNHQEERKMLTGTLNTPTNTPNKDDGFMKYGSYFVAALLLVQAYIIICIVG